MSTAEQGAVPKDRSHQSRSYAGQSHLVLSADCHTGLDKFTVILYYLEVMKFV